LIKNNDICPEKSVCDEFKNYDCVLKKQPELKILDGRGILSEANYSIGK